MATYTDKSTLNEVRAGQAGFGLLVERDAGIITGNKDVVSQIKEDIEKGHKFVIPDHFVVSAVFQKYGIKNANGRIYPEQTLKREVAKYMEERVAKRCALGALDHPASSSLSGHDVSHNIIDLRWEGCTLVGEMELQTSPGYVKYGVCSTSGDLVANLILSDYLIGVSSRAVGSVEERNGVLVVGDDLELVCWDVVLEPSTPSSYIRLKPNELEPFIDRNAPSNSIPSGSTNKFGGSSFEDRLARIAQLMGK